MNPVFTINFRREAFQREIARARRRLIGLGAWLTYFGLMAVILGLYGLNCFALGSRVRSIERRTAQFEAAQKTNRDWNVDATQLATVERFHISARRWRDRMIGLSSLLPSNVVLASAAVNPDNLTNPVDVNKLVLVGYVRGSASSDRMQTIVQLVSKMHSDSLFSGGYQNIRLVSSRVVNDGPMTEFVIECR